MSSWFDDAALAAALRTAPVASYNGHAFRVLNGGWVVDNLTFDHLFAGNSAGRCNPAGITRLYLGLEKETARAEFRYYAASSGMNPDLAEEYGFAIECHLSRVLDFRETIVRKHLSITLKEMLADWQPDPLAEDPPSMTKLQAIGAMIAKGEGDFSAIIFPSARCHGKQHQGSNIVIFKDCLQQGRDSIKPVTKKAVKGWP